jgi:hypothetical protein
MEKMSKYPQIPNDCLPYHPRSELNGRQGYFPNVSGDQLKAVNELIALVEKENLRFNCDEEHEFLKLLRFLRARKFNVRNAFHMIKEDVNWRSEDNRLNLRHEVAEEVLGCDLAKMYRYFPTWIQGQDKQMRPVSYRQFGKFEIWNVLKLTSMHKLIRFHAWETEQALRFMHGRSQKVGYNIETFVLVIDASGWSMQLATRDAFTFIKGMATTDSDHYPERLGTMIIINAPSALAWAWSIIQGFLDPVTKAKVRIIGCDQKEWLPVLLEHIDEDQIPKQYGGTADDLPAEEAIKQMNPTYEQDEQTSDSAAMSRMKVDQGIQTDDPIELLFDATDSGCACIIS